MLRGSGGAAYEQAVMHWERSGGQIGLPAIPPLLDRDLTALTLAPVLNVPAALVWRQPQHLIAAATIRLRLEQKQVEQAQKKSRKAAMDRHR